MGCRRSKLIAVAAQSRKRHDGLRRKQTSCVAVGSDLLWVGEGLGAVPSGFAGAVLLLVMELSTIFDASHNFGLEHT